MQVLGLCRFSFPGKGGFKITYDTVEDRRNYLYSSARLEERFRLFETITLPCFKEQTDEDFTLLVVIGTCLPRWAQDRLHDLTSGLKQVQIIARPADTSRNSRFVMQDILNEARLNPDLPCLQFRHDDDDAVSVDFVERMHLATREVKQLCDDHCAFGIDFNQGYLARVNGDGIRAGRVFVPLLGVGLGMFIKGGSQMTIFDHNHGRLSRFMPVISYPDAPMWVRSLNPFNDSPHARNNPIELPLLNAQEQAEFTARYAIGPDLVRAVYTQDTEPLPETPAG